MMSTDSVINFVDAVAVYNGYPALAGVTLRVERNEIVLLQGPNGAGKSTAMRMIGATSQRTSGDLTILDKDPDKFGPQIRAHLGVVPQQDNLDTHCG